jgi:hypothetical protein
VRIFGEKVFRLGVEIREVAAAAAGDQDFFADFFGAFEEHDAATAFARFDGTHQTGCAAAEDDYVEVGQLNRSPFEEGIAGCTRILSMRGYL